MDRYHHPAMAWSRLTLCVYSTESQDYTLTCEKDWLGRECVFSASQYILR